MAFWRLDTGRNNRLAATRSLRVLQPSTHRWVNRIQSGTAQNVADYENGSSRLADGGASARRTAARIFLGEYRLNDHRPRGAPSGKHPVRAKELLGCVGTQLLSSRRFRVG